MDFIGIAGDLIMWLFSFVFGLIYSFLSIILYPFNLAMYALLPDLSSNIETALDGLNVMIGNSAWVLSIFPRILIITLAFCYGFRYAVSSVVLSHKFLIKVWNVLQKVKFW